jgi:hypothetical protein
MRPDVSFLWSSTAPLHALPTASGCDPLAPEHVVELRRSFSPGPRWGTCFPVVNADSPVFALTNTRYLISRAPVDSARFRLDSEIAGYRIYQNTRVTPRVFLANRTRRAPDLASAAWMLRQPDFDPAGAIVEADVTGLEPGPRGGAEVISYGAADLLIRTHADRPALLVVADTYYPGWKASIDGAPAPIIPTNVAFRGVVIPTGRHEVRMHFAPRILYRAAVVSAMAWTLAAVVFLRRRGRP